jgi:hypothetical protein
MTVEQTMELIDMIIRCVDAQILKPEEAREYVINLLIGWTAVERKHLAEIRKI